MGLIKRMGAWFDRLQARFTYRQRFLFFALIYILILPYSLYVALHTVNFMIQSKKVQLLGAGYQRELGTLYDALLRYQVIQDPSTDLKKSLDREVHGALEALRDMEERNPDLFPKQYGTVTELNLFGWQKRWNIAFNEGSSSLAPLVADVKKTLERSGEDMLLFSNDDLLVERLATPIIRFLPGIEMATARLEKSDAEVNVLEEKSASMEEDLSQAILQFEKNYPERSDQISRMQTALADFRKPGTAEEMLWNQEQLRMTLLTAIEDIVEQGINSFRWAKGFIIAACSLSSLLIFFFILSRALSSHFIELANHMQDLSKGSITSRHAPLSFCSKETDEFGEIGRQLDIMAQKTSQSVAEIQEFHKKILEVQTHLSFISHDETETLRRQEEALSTLDSTMQNVARKTRQLAETMEGLNQQSNAGAQVDERLKQLQSNMGSLVEEASRIVKLMTAVEDKVAGMNTLITYIHKVSERANLLSLNAAIETATVTKKRESFASIAQKIQRFAVHTSASTQEIRTIFQEMSSNVAGIKSQAVTCYHEIHTGAERLVPVNNQLKRITQRGMEQKQKYEHFGSALQAQAAQAEELMQSIIALKTTALDNQQLAQTLQTAFEQIEATTRELKRLLKKWDKK